MNSILGELFGIYIVVSMIGFPICFMFAITKDY